MAVGKEIRTKIKSVQNTQKITRAMQMVATSKMRKTQERMRQARPYAEKIREVMAHLAETNTDISHPFLDARDDVKRVGIILISSDKGLCGGLNANVLRQFFNEAQSLMDKGVEIDVFSLCLIHLLRHLDHALQSLAHHILECSLGHPVPVFIRVSFHRFPPAQPADQMRHNNKPLTFQQRGEEDIKHVFSGFEAFQFLCIRSETIYVGHRQIIHQHHSRPLRRADR